MVTYKLAVEFHIDLDPITLREAALGVPTAPSEGKPGLPPEIIMQLSDDPRMALGLVLSGSLSEHIESALPGSTAEVTGLVAEAV